MRYIDLAGPTDRLASRISVLGFGCAPLMGRVGRKDSLDALSRAEASGINFFDIARSYGYGESEALVGAFLKGRRQSVVLCTKFGILPGRTGWKQKVKPLAQAAIRIFPGLRKHARKQAAGTSSGGHFTVDTLRDSFETSLRELQTDYVDMLLLHAATSRVLDQDDLFEALERLVESGKVRMAGISGDHAAIAETFRRQPKALTTAQFAMDPSSLGFAQQTLTPEAQKMLLVANHPFGGPAGTQSLLKNILAMSSAETLPDDLRAKLGSPDTQLMAEILLNVILQCTGVSVVLPSMVRESSLNSNVRAIEECRFTKSELDFLKEELVRTSGS